MTSLAAAVTIRVVIADNQPLVLQTLTRLLGACDDFEVAASCHDGDDLIRAVHQHTPDIVVLGLWRSSVEGLELASRLRSGHHPTRVVLLTARLADAELLEASRLGVAGVIPKEMGPERLIDCIRQVHAGSHPIEKTIEALRRRQITAALSLPALTGREVEIVKLTATGVRNRQIAGHLRISEGTVKAHLSNIYGKLGLASRLQLALYARSHGIS